MVKSHVSSSKSGFLCEPSNIGQRRYCRCFHTEAFLFDCGCIDTIPAGLKYFVPPMSTPPSVKERQILTPAELGSAISELRSLRRKTQSEVATALSIDRSQLAHLEGGRSGRYLLHLLNILDCLGAELHIHWQADPAAAKAPAAPAASRPSTSKATSLISRSPGVGQLEASTASSATRTSLQPAEPSQAPTAVLPTPNPAELSPATPPESPPESAREPGSVQLTKITNQAMNVMAASQQLRGSRRPTPTTPA